MRKIAIRKKLCGLAQDMIGSIKEKEHNLQSHVISYLRMKNCITIDCDVMSALRYLSKNDNRRILFINQHKGMGYTNGQPDLLFITPTGRLVFVEMKTSTGRQSKEQKQFEEDIKCLGFEYYVWRNVDDAIEFFD